MSWAKLKLILSLPQKDQKETQLIKVKANLLVAYIRAHLEEIEEVSNLMGQGQITHHRVLKETPKKR